MPLTAAEKMRAYRERIKQNPEKAEQIKEKDRNRKYVKKIAMTPNEKLVEKEKNQNRVAKHRALKKGKSTSPKWIPGQIQAGNLVCAPFTSPQSLGKAKKKVMDVLPSSPRKRKAVVEAVAFDVGLGAVKKPRTDGEISSESRRH